MSGQIVCFLIGAAVLLFLIGYAVAEDMSWPLRIRLLLGAGFLCPFGIFGPFVPKRMTRLKDICIANLFSIVMLAVLFGYGYVSSELWLIDVVMLVGEFVYIGWQTTAWMLDPNSYNDLA